MRLTTTIVRSWSATLVGTFFTLVTAFVLLEDCIRHGAPFTTKHLMTLAVLAGTVYFGHRVHIELRSWRLGWALGCAILFLGGTAFCVSMSAGRNAEALTVKALEASSANSGRVSAQKDRDEARVRYQAALKAEEDECSSGSGTKCQSKRITRMVRREEYDAAEKALRQQQPEQVANGDVKSAAQLFSRLPLVTADASSIEALLLLLNPFLQSLFCEVAAIVGFGMGIGHRPATVSNRENPPPAMTTVSSHRFRRKHRPISLSDKQAVLTALQQAGRPVTNDELAALMRVTKGESSKRVASLNGAVEKVRIGRCVAISVAGNSGWKQ